MANFPNSIPRDFVVRSVASAGTSFTNLKPFELGIFDEDTHLALSPADIQKRRRVYLGVGSPNVPQFTQGTKYERFTNPLNADINFRSEPITRTALDEIRLAIPRKTEKPNIYYLGYNGMDNCEGLKFECGKTYSFHVTVQGRPVFNIFQRPISEIITIDTDCCSPCSSGDCDLEEPCQKYIDKLVAEFNDQNRWTSRFFVAEKIMDCGTAIPGLTRTNFVEYTLTVCDNGDELDLSAVQNQYPTLSVKVKSRNAPFTTYQVIKTTGLPAAFTQSDVVLQNCATCPSGYTAAAAGYLYVVEVDDALYTAAAGGNANAKLGTLAGVTVTSNTVLSTLSDKKIYQIVTSTAISSPAAGLVVTATLGTVPARCTLTTPVSTAWVAGESYYKVQRDLCITLKVDDCDADHDGADAGETLARMTSFYGSNSEVVSGSLALEDSTNCLLRYTISQYCTNFLQDGCDTTEEGLAKFNTLPPFEGQRWEVCPCEGWTVDGNGCPVPPTPTTNCCRCGIKFTTRPTTYIIDQFRGYDIAMYLEKEPVELIITPYRNDDDTSVCDYDNVRWRQTQFATFRQLSGYDVVKNIIRERFAHKQPWVNQLSKEDQLFLQREGIKIGINVEDYYYQIAFDHNVQYNKNYTATTNDLKETVFLYVNEGDLSVVDSVKAVLATSFPDAKLVGFN